MLNRYSIRKCAEIVEITIATSFFWRHKILNCISEFLGVGSIDGLVEADEVFFAYSYKGTVIFLFLWNLAGGHHSKL